MKNKHPQKLRSYVALFSVILVGVIGISVATSLLLLGLDFWRTSYSGQQSDQARSYADACAEVALDRIRENISYSGSDSITFSNGSCEIRPIIGAGTETPTVETRGLVGESLRKVRIVLNQVRPQIVISQWLEVAEY